MSTITCPACKKKNVSTDNCVRCNCDLSSLIKIIKTAEISLSSGFYFLKQGNGEAALHYAQISWNLKKNHIAAKLAFLSCMQLKKFDEGKRWYVKAVKPSG